MENNNGCLVCGQDMMQSDGCRVAVMYHCGEQYVRIPFRGLSWGTLRRLQCTFRELSPLGM